MSDTSIVTVTFHTSARSKRERPQGVPEVSAGLAIDLLSQLTTLAKPKAAIIYYQAIILPITGA